MRNRKGFTLIELLLVISIIGVLGGMILSAVSVVRQKSAEVQCLGDCAQLSISVDAAKSTWSIRYIPSYTLLQPKYDTRDAVQSAAARELQMVFGSRFMRADPTDPAILVAGGGTPLPNFGVINGNQCLVFFLGGYRGGQFGSGFAAGSDPFTTVNNPVATGAFFNFAANRLFVPPGGGVPLYFDTHRNTVPYYYFTSQLGGDYAKADRVLNPSGQCSVAAGAYTCAATGEVVVLAALSSSPLQYQDGRYFAPSAQQIVSAGRDGLVGPGGPIDLQDPNNKYLPYKRGYDDQSSISGRVLGLVYNVPN